MPRLLVSLINFYQKHLSFDKGALAFLAPGGACKYEISCSEYTKQAIQNKGAMRGVWLGFKRVLSCNPWKS